MLRDDGTTDLVEILRHDFLYDDHRKEWRVMLAYRAALPWSTFGALYDRRVCDERSATKAVASGLRHVNCPLLKAQPRGDLRIMAQLQTLKPTLRTPAPSPRDSDDVLLALQTAHALEVRGDLAEAVRWLQRAADEAEKQGNDTRVLALAHAAADLTSASRQASTTSPPVDEQRVPHDSDPTLHWRATPPPLPSRTSSLPARASSVPAHSAPISILRERAMPKEQPVTARPKARMEAVRVAIKKPSNARSFLVERLDAHQPLPSGTVEALLVLMGDVDDGAER